LIDDVRSGVADFSAILVYDVSRWGRFQDADESAYYEFICKEAGITVHYCAEQFENDGSPELNHHQEHETSDGRRSIAASCRPRSLRGNAVSSALAFDRAGWLVTAYGGS